MTLGEMLLTQWLGWEKAGVLDITGVLAYSDLDLLHFQAPGVNKPKLSKPLAVRFLLLAAQVLCNTQPELRTWECAPQQQAGTAVAGRGLEKGHPEIGASL